ncbi:polysaccharide pyruvyl transferase family protein [Ensifer sp. LCM 4579]|uniref:polysaccharide pyruvyl transferase family protein n=1 Tax=Ensifer sp. LCM 4579 TaxID=1848292 RepID=UPI0008DB2D51|nr:polysaccharide pyruvyl transferase family protein [Ensifer sp. LCM 4579]OHV81890.1 polysaccharide pyruvyl transferase [Ensifer sp. LCM 4579]
MPKVGILTFHRCINYGSYWQARCLVDGLRSLGAEPEILDHRSQPIRSAEWRCAFQPLLPARSARADFPLYASKIRKFAEAIASYPLSGAFEIDSPADIEPFDLVLVGSDEVWNLSHPWYGGRPIFYGEGVPARRLVSYAATFGNLPAAQGIEVYWADKLRKFDGISVRDTNSRVIIEKDLKRRATLVLDPCLQFPASLARSRQSRSTPPYLAVYGHSFPKWFQVGVRRWAASCSLDIISIGYRNDWADQQWLEAGPYEFAAFIAGSAAVATNFFHGCVFSLINAKPFVCTLSDYRSNKIGDLTRTVGAEDHLVSEETPQATYEARLGEPLDPGIEGRIAKLRLQSGTYLADVLQ